MKKCTKCNFEVNTNRRTCPLCFEPLTELTPTTYTPLFPEYHKKHKKSNILLKIFGFIAIASALITFIINLVTLNEASGWWCLYVIIAVIYVYILVHSAIISKTNVANKLVIQTFTCSIVTWVINYLSDYSIKWSIDYVIPFLSIASAIVIMILFLAKAIRFSEYVMYMLAQLLLGVVPFILWIFGVADVLWACLCAACFSLTMFLSMIFFSSSEMKEEMKKRFHI